MQWLREGSVQDLWWLLGAAWELPWGITRLQEGLVWLESRDSSELMDNPGLLQRPSQTQPPAGRGARICPGFLRASASQGAPSTPWLQAHPWQHPWHIQLPPPPRHRAGRVPAGAGSGTVAVAPRGAAGRVPGTRGCGSSERRAPAPPLPARELPDAEAAGAKQLRQHKSTVTAPERLSPGVRKNTS